MADVLTDACCLINLLSSGRPRDVLGNGGHDFHVCEAVADESLYIDELTANQTRQRTRADLEPLFRSNAIRLCKPETSDETAAFVHYATLMDDGEAMCLALAKHRSWAVATDDRKARRIATGEGIALFNTIELVRGWAERNDIAESLIRELIQRIAILGRYRPTENAPSANWWRSKGGPLSM